MVPDRRFCIAPMMGCTDRHERYFLRLISGRAMLYTEMIPAAALLAGSPGRFLAHSAEESPVGLQVGGCDPDGLARCAELAEAAGFDEININVGCPSAKVQSGRFGACLMAEPELVSVCIRQMVSRVGIPVTVKCRIGIDGHDRYEDLLVFVETLAASGCRTFHVHARKAWLNGLSPKQNREVPPLHYETVYRLKAEHPELEIIVNGGIRSIGAAKAHLQTVDGVMVGREVYHNPFRFADIDRQLYGVAVAELSRFEILNRYKVYMAEQLQSGVHLKQMTRHILGLFHGQPGARAWRRDLSEHQEEGKAGLEVLDRAEAGIRQQMRWAA